MQSIKLIACDFDQTLVNSRQGFDVAFNKIMEDFKNFLEKHNIELDLESNFPRLKKKMRDLDAQKQYNRDLWWNLLLKELNIENLRFTEEECKTLTETYWSTAMEYTEFYPDTLEILDYLKNKEYKLGLITDTDGTPGIKQIRLEKSGILDYFDAVIIAGEDIPEIKPSPKAFLKLASLVEISPEESVMVGDKPFTDIKGAKAAGFHTILILRGNWTVDPKPDFQIQNLIELKSIL